MFARDALTYYSLARNCVARGEYRGEPVVRFPGGYERYTTLLAEAHEFMGFVDPHEYHDALATKRYELALANNNHLGELPAELQPTFALLEDLPRRFTAARPGIAHLATWPTIIVGRERLAPGAALFFEKRRSIDRQLAGLATALDELDLNV